MRATLCFAFWLTLAFAAGLVLRLYVIAIYHVPTPSMAPLIMPKDIILAIKPTLASRKVPNRGEVWLFQKPTHDESPPEIMVKRLFATPGDTIIGVNGEFKVNGVVVAQVVHDHGVVSVNTLPYPSNLVFPNDTSIIRWMAMDFGPLWVPRTGSTIALNVENLALYQRLILNESSEIQIDSFGHLIVDGERLKEYTFKRNYYFACGDNLIQSNDSRHWGFIPESHLQSKALLVLMSSNLNLTLRGRVFLKIR